MFETILSPGDLLEGLEDEELCRIYWRGVPKLVSTYGVSCEYSIDVQIDNVRQI